MVEETADVPKEEDVYTGILKVPGPDGIEPYTQERDPSNLRDHFPSRRLLTTKVKYSFYFFSLMCFTKTI